MASPCPPIRPRHIGVAGAGLLLLSAASFWLASTQHTEQVGGFRPVRSDSGSAGYAIERWQLPSRHRWLFLSSMGLCLVTTGLLTIVNISQDETLLNLETLQDDIPDTIQVLCLHVNQFLSAGVQLVASVALLTGKRTARFLYLRTAPVPVKDAIAQLSLDRTWFRKFLKARHNWVTGRTGSGKTFLTLALIIDWLEANPDGILTICDLAYGKPDEDGWINDWLGLPIEYIRMETDAIAAAIEAERTELDDRRHQGQQAATSGKRRIQRKAPRLLVIDEWDSTIEQLGGKDGQFFENVRFILKFGGGYGHKILLSGQTIATGETAISEATRNQLSIAILGTNSTKTDEVGKLKSESQPLLDRARKIRQRGHRAAIVQLGDADPVTVIVPELRQILNVRVIVETQDSDLDWWMQIFTPAMQQEMQAFAERYVTGEINSPLKAIAQKLGCSVRSSDVRYTRFVKPAWETLLAQYQPNLQEQEKNV